MENGQTLTHNRYGLGTIANITAQYVEVQFTGQLVKLVPSFVESLLGTPAAAAPAKKDWGKHNAKVKAARDKAAADYKAYAATRTEDQRIADGLMEWGASMYKDGSLMNDREGILHEVSTLGGFAADVAKTCLKYGKVSQKQAAIIAAAFTNR
jgi:hypothetical protein